VQKHLVVLIFAGAGIFAGPLSASAKTVPYSSHLSASSLRFECGLMGGKFGEYTDKAGRHFYWCVTATGTIKCLDNICTQTTPDKKRVPPTNVATGNNNQKIGNKPKPPLATTNAAAPAAAGKGAGADAVAGPGVASRATNAGTVSAAAQKTPPLVGGAFAGSGAPTLRGPAGSADRRLP